MSWRPIQEYINYRFAPYRGSQSSRALFDEWAADKDIVRFSTAMNRADWPRILQTGRRTELPYDMPQDDPPEIDHAAVFKSRTGKCWLTYQPYSVADALRPLVLAWARTHGLRAAVYDKDRSWYNPGGTCLVVVETGCGK